jgi:threonyl-tRNA synthetase
MGDKEATSEAVSVRTRGKGDEGSLPLADFIQRANALIDQKSPGL